MHAIQVLVLLVAVYTSLAIAADIRPQQVRLSVTGNPSEMLVSWFVANTTSGNATVRYGVSQDALHLTSTSSSQVVTYTEDGWFGATYSILMENLLPATTYFYQCGHTEGEWSTVYRFTTESTKPGAVTRMAWFGDMGATEANDTIALLAAQSQAGNYSLVFHVGDIAYCNYGHDQGDEQIWNTFLSEIEPIAAYTPYMVAPGNHDRMYKWRGYLKTFRMPPVEHTLEQRKAWFEFSYQNVHFISFSTEHDYTIVSEQFWWLESRLKNYHANLRQQYPWLILYAHRPIRCSNAWGWCSDWTQGGGLLHISIGPLLEKYKVDIFVAGHTHSYERSHPINNAGDVVPGGTVHLVAGSPGDREGFDLEWTLPQPHWSAARNSYQGFGVMTVYNSTHLEWQFVRSETGEVYDSYWLVKE